MRDLYYPYVGQLNHIGGYHCRIGIWVDGVFSWLSDSEWNFGLSYLQDSLVTEVKAAHPGLGISLVINDGIHQREDIYLKRVRINNEYGSVREVRMFFNQDLVINETEVGDTAAYYPGNNTVFSLQEGPVFHVQRQHRESGNLSIYYGCKKDSIKPRGPGETRKTAI